MSNLQTVQSIYSAFGRGDIPGILNHLHEDVEWEYGMLNAGVPWLQPRKGRAEIPKFFQALGGIDLKTFQPQTLLENGNVVVALIDVAFVVKSTGQAVNEEDEVHIWHFDDQGRVTRFCHKCDTYQHWVAQRDR